MSNSIFLNVIVQLKEATDRVFGVIDSDGCVVSSTDVSLLGERWAEAALKVAGSSDTVVFAQKSFKALDRTITDAILTAMVQGGAIRQEADRYALPDFKVVLTKRQTQLRQQILHQYQTAGREVPFVEDLYATFPANQQEDCRKVLESEYPEVNKAINLALPDEKFRRVGQSMAAASLAESR